MMNHEEYAILKDVQRTGGFIIPMDKKNTKFKGADGLVIKGLTAEVFEKFKDDGLLAEPEKGTADDGVMILSSEVPELLNRKELLTFSGDNHDDATMKKRAAVEAQEAADEAKAAYEQAQAAADDAKEKQGDAFSKAKAVELQKTADELKKKYEQAQKAAEKAAA